MRAMKMRGTVDGHWKLTNTKWEHHQRWSSYSDMRSRCELSIDHSTVVRHLQQSGKVKKLDEWVPHELISNQKDHHFEVSSSLILCNNNEPFLDRIVTCDETWVLFYSGDHQLSGGTEKKLESTSQSQTCTKKGVILTVWKSAARLIHYKLSESKWNYYIWEVYTTNRWAAPKTVMPAASTGQQNVPNSSPWQCPITHHTTKSSKVNE